MAKPSAGLVPPTLVLLLLLLLLEVDLQGGPNIRKAEAINCNGKCKRRCSKATRQQMCLRDCNACCHRCHCVPPGTNGNRDACRCYANLKTHGGRYKCP